ncbi:hypothetical protein HG566_06655 [Helicobacter pylori]|uniref:hypothetical protein n=1 Tax=Helicobacter pylori TaxID=210 RepID=UPI0019230F4B|nr:hypothetical protein [Helicobacter pylori]QQW88465.1 hypothetical protein HG566_06655 [Helicobacter pylori]
MIKIKYSGITTPDDFAASGRLAKAIKKHGIKEVDKMVRDHSKHEAEKEKLKDKVIDALERESDALRRESDMKDRIIEILTEKKYRDEEKEHSKSCLGLE